MKKIVFLVMSAVMLFVTSACSSPDVVDYDSPIVPDYSVIIDVDCVENLLLSKYDVCVYVDGERLGTHEHGTKGTYETVLSEGEHTVSFKKEDDTSVYGTSDIDIVGDSIFKYEISCKMDHINVKLLETMEKTSENAPVVTPETHITMPESAYVYLSEDYGKVVDNFKKMGFKNVKAEVVYDLDTGWLDKVLIGKTESIYINGSNNFKKGEVFDKNSEVIVKYSELEINNPDIEYHLYTVSQLIKELETNAMNAKDKHLYEYVEIKGKISSIDASGKDFRLYASEGQDDYIYCEIEVDEARENLKEVSTGDIVSIRGKVTLVGEVLGYSMDAYKILK